MAAWTREEARACEDRHHALGLEIRDVKKKIHDIDACAGKKLSKWSASILVTILILVIGACCSLASYAVARTIEQGERTAKVETSNADRLRRLDKLDEKMDEVLRLLRGQ